MDYRLQIESILTALHAPAGLLIKEVLANSIRVDHVLTPASIHNRATANEDCGVFVGGNLKVRQVNDLDKGIAQIASFNFNSVLQWSRSSLRKIVSDKLNTVIWSSERCPSDSATLGRPKIDFKRSRSHRLCARPLIEASGCRVNCGAF